MCIINSELIILDGRYFMAEVTPVQTKENTNLYTTSGAAAVGAIGGGVAGYLTKPFLKSITNYTLNGCPGFLVMGKNDRFKCLQDIINIFSHLWNVQCKSALILIDG